MKRMKRLISKFAMTTMHTRPGGFKGPSMRKLLQVRKRTLAFALGIFVFTTLIPAMETRAAVDSTVYPTGVWPDDVHNVQAAIDQGGNVLLKATNAAGQPTAFNFGTPEILPDRFVFLTTDVSILGEQVGSNMTTIQGGFGPIRSPVPVKSRIEGIDFEGPLLDAIDIFASTGSDIIANRINNVVPFLAFFGFTVSDGIDIAGNSDPEHAITGKVRVADNVIENLHGDIASGIQFDGVAADSEISGNTINLGPGDHRQGTEIVVVRSHSSG